MREAPSTPFTQTLGSSSNQSAIRQRDFSGRQKTLITQESLGVYLVSVLLLLRDYPGAPELRSKLVQGGDVGRQGGLDLAGGPTQTERGTETELWQLTVWQWSKLSSSTVSVCCKLHIYQIFLCPQLLGALQRGCFTCVTQIGLPVRRDMKWSSVSRVIISNSVGIVMLIVNCIFCTSLCISCGRYSLALIYLQGKHICINIQWSEQLHKMSFIKRERPKTGHRIDQSSHPDWMWHITEDVLNLASVSNVASPFFFKYKKSTCSNSS